MPFRIRSKAQRAVIAIALRKVGRSLRGSPRRIGSHVRNAPKVIMDAGKSAKEVVSHTINETLPGVGAKVIATKIAESDLIKGASSAARQAIPDSIKRFGASVLGHKGALGRGVGHIQSWIHKFQRSKIRAPGTKVAATVAGRMVGETSKVVGVMGREALEAVGETATGRRLSASLHVAKKVLESPLPKTGSGLLPPIGSPMRDIRHTVTGRLILKLRRKFSPRVQGLREAVHSAFGGARTPLRTRRVPVREGENVTSRIAPGVTERRRGAAQMVRSGVADLADLRRPGAIRQTGGLSAAKRAVRAARGKIERGFTEHRDIRRTVRTKGLENIPLAEIGVGGSVASYYLGKKIKAFGSEMKRQREARQTSVGADEVVARETRILKQNYPWLSDLEVETRAQSKAVDFLLAGQRRQMERQQAISRGILQHEAQLERSASQRHVRSLRGRSPDMTQTKSPRESKLNSIKNKFGRLGQLFGGGGKNRPRTTRKRKKR